MLEKVDLPGIVRGLKEWSEGYEALEAIPFSFVIEFKDGGVWSLYSDSEEEKVILIVLKILLKLMLDVFLVPDVGAVTPCSWAVISMYLICIISIPISNSQPNNDLPQSSYVFCLFRPSVTNIQTIERYRRSFFLHPISCHEVLLNAWRGPEAFF